LTIDILSYLIVLSKIDIVVFIWNKFGLN